jgi:hypothetical protein
MARSDWIDGSVRRVDIPAWREPTVDELRQDLPADRLLQETVEPDAPGIDRVGLPTPSGQRDQEDAAMARVRSQSPRELETVHHRHGKVTHDGIGSAVRDLGQAFAPVGSDHDAKSMELEQALNNVPHTGVVVDHENGR